MIVILTAENGQCAETDNPSGRAWRRIVRELDKRGVQYVVEVVGKEDNAAS